jgi:acyl-homoserine-lactone acylase
MEILIDPTLLNVLYASSLESLKKLMNAWADGLNFYIALHPNNPRFRRRRWRYRILS